MARPKWLVGTVVIAFAACSGNPELPDEETAGKADGLTKIGQLGGACKLDKTCSHGLVCNTDQNDCQIFELMMPDVDLSNATALNVAGPDHIALNGVIQNGIIVLLDSGITEPGEYAMSVKSMQRSHKDDSLVPCSAKGSVRITRSTTLPVAVSTGGWQCSSTGGRD